MLTLYFLYLIICQWIYLPIDKKFWVGRHVYLHIHMTRTRISIPSLVNGSTEVKIIERSWGIERCYVTPDGVKVCTPAPFSTNHRNLDWTFLS